MGTLSVSGTSTLGTINCGTLVSSGNITGVNIEVAGNLQTFMSSSGVSAYNFVTYGTNILSNDITVNEATTPIAVGASITSLNSSTATNTSSITTLNTNLTALNTTYTNFTYTMTRVWCGGYVSMGTSTATTTVPYQCGGGIGFSCTWIQTGIVNITMSSPHPSGGPYYTLHLQAMGSTATTTIIAVNVFNLPQTASTFRVCTKDAQNSYALIKSDFRSLWCCE